MKSIIVESQIGKGTRFVFALTREQSEEIGLRLCHHGES